MQDSRACTPGPRQWTVPGTNVPAANRITEKTVPEKETAGKPEPDLLPVRMATIQE